MDENKRLLFKVMYELRSNYQEKLARELMNLHPLL